MAIPKLKKQDIIDALNYIDEHGIPSQNESAKYKLVTDDGKRYPPKYVIAVADHLANGKEISTAFGPSEAISFLESVQFKMLFFYTKPRVILLIKQEFSVYYYCRKCSFAICKSTQ